MTTEKATYKSPIEIFINDVNYSMEQAVLAAVSKVGIKVDKDELVKALAYDRQQYEEGYRNAMKQMPGWIPVTERLPIEFLDRRILVSTVSPTGRGSVDIGLWEGGKWTTYFPIGDDKVTAWMPLPKPYEEEQK